MHRSEVDELYYIVPLDNIASIITTGILSNARASRIAHSSVAMTAIQERRDNVRVPGGRPLHEYANLYFCARNPMMFKIVRTSGSDGIAVLAVDASILEAPGVVIADGNASSGYTRFAASPSGLVLIDHVRVHAERWDRYELPPDYWEHKRVKCAEVLVPDRVPPELIIRAIVPSAPLKARVTPIVAGRPVAVATTVFFR